MDAQQRKSSVAWLSVVSNGALVLIKLLVGLAIGSVSIISEALHSGVDLAASIISLVAVRTSGKPADREHPYGHGKIENISGFLEALLIALAALWIISEAIQKLAHPAHMTMIGWGIAVMCGSALANFVVSRLLLQVGKETASLALQADGAHLRTDVLTSVGVMTSLLCMAVISRVFGVYCSWLDPVAAMAVAGLLFATAYDLTRKSLGDLLDASLPAEEEAWIREHIDRLRPTIRGFHRLRTRKAGAARFVELDLLVEAAMSVEKAHSIAEMLTHDIEECFPHTSVTVHIEPCDGQCEEICVQGCFLSEEERRAQQRAVSSEE